MADMRASDVARAERAQLADLFDEVGPDAPTLCGDWTTRDLAAHLVIREARPDAAIGIVVPQLAGYTESVQAREAQKRWPELVDAVRTGPPIYSPFRLPGVAGIADLFEFVVHHEDVRRGSPGWQPRDLPTGEQDLLWERLGKASRMLTKSCPVGVELRRSDTGQTATLKPGTPAVTLVGAPLEMLLRLFGRSEVVLEVEGPETALAAFEAASFGV
jgi:uncharacterized protein (TIGR03085 family)